MSTLLQQLAQPDDRWDVTDAVRRMVTSGDRAKRVLQLDPSWDLFFDAEAPVALVAPDGRVLALKYDQDRHALHGPGMAGLVTAKDMPQSAWRLVLESAAPPRFSLRAETQQQPALVASLTTERGVRLSFTSDEDLALLARLSSGFRTQPAGCHLRRLARL